MCLFAVFFGILNSGAFKILRVLLVITAPAKDAGGGKEEADGRNIIKVPVSPPTVSCLQRGDTADVSPACSGLHGSFLQFNLG